MVFFANRDITIFILCTYFPCLHANMLEYKDREMYETYYTSISELVDGFLIELVM